MRFRRQSTSQLQAIRERNEARMSFIQHLLELRNRFLWSFASLVIGTVIGFFFAADVLDILRTPYCNIVDQPADCQLVILGPTGGILAYFRVALLMGGVIAIPMITYHFMMFILPGFEDNEKRIVLFSLPAITLLFLAGVAFTWFILMPPALGFLQGFQPTLFRPEWTADLYLSFMTALIFWMGVSFQMPLVFFVLAFLGIVQPSLLIKNWRIAVVLSSIAAAFITPTIDPVNMFLVMGPLLALYGLSIITVWLGSRFSSAQPEA